MALNERIFIKIVNPKSCWAKILYNEFHQNGPSNVWITCRNCFTHVRRVSVRLSLSSRNSSFFRGINRRILHRISPKSAEEFRNYGHQCRILWKSHKVFSLSNNWLETGRRTECLRITFFLYFFTKAQNSNKHLWEVL